jgi:hypothetical protein
MPPSPKKETKASTEQKIRTSTVANLINRHFGSIDRAPLQKKHNMNTKTPPSIENVR